MFSQFIAQTRKTPSKHLIMRTRKNKWKIVHGLQGMEFRAHDPD